MNIPVNLRSNLDFDFHAAGQFELHQGIDGFRRRTVDVEKSFVSAELKLFARFFVHES